MTRAEPNHGNTARIRRLDASETRALGVARFLASRSHRYFSAALYAMQPYAIEGFGTFAVDRRWRLYVDPECLRRWTPEETAGVLLHEVGHLVRDHASRGERIGASLGGTGRHLRWNLAADMAINDDLLGDQVLLPGSPVTPHTFGFPAGLLEEDYYTRLEPSGAKGCDCGSGADGQTRPWELPVSESDPGVSASQAASVRRQVAEAVRGIDSVPAGLRRWAEASVERRPDWRQQLHAALRRPRRWRAGRHDKTWQRPNRRASCTPGILLPGQRSPRMEIAVVVDTSASITVVELGAALGEIDAIRAQCGLGELWVIACDAQPSPPKRVRSTAPLSLHGGGGTDLRPAIAMLAHLQPRPDVAVIITDGHTPWPGRAPHGISIVVATTDVAPPHPNWTTIALTMP
jgi:predicted metal-dependent peptidase